MSDLTGKLILGRYRVDGFIGRGGMAEVYKVWDTRRNTTLAMKLLHADLALDRALLRRFHREAETLARLQHPNIVRFYGLEQDGEQIFMLMDFIEGKSLKQMIFNANGPLPFDQVLDIMRQLCQALQYAHYEGFIHADVKPGNVLIDKSGRVMLNDFGIARMAETSTATMAGAGTSAYMSPEQARGERPVPQSDIYALGIVLYEMLTGERPFNGAHSKARGTADDKVRWEQINLAPPSPHETNPKVPAELETVVLKALAKDSSQRYASALEFSQEVEFAIGMLPGVQAHETEPKSIEQPVHEKTATQQETKRTRLDRYRIPFVGFIALVILLVFLTNGEALSYLFADPTPTATGIPTATRTIAQTFIVIPSPTTTALPTATQLPSATPTPLVPIVMAKDLSAHCRLGPGTGWEAISALVLGTPAEIAGKNTELTWWYINDPLHPGEFCWVAMSVTETGGNLASIPIVPAPTASVTGITVKARVEFSGCGGPNPITFEGTIKTNGPTTVTYQWEVTGDMTNTTNPETLVFEGAATKNVTNIGAYAPDCGDYFINLHVTSPNDKSAKEDFSVPP